MKEYFLTRRQWAMDQEKELRKQASFFSAKTNILLREQSSELESRWAKKLEERIKLEKEKITIEKDLEIRLLEEELNNTIEKNKELKKDSFKIEKLKNELQAKIQHIDYQNKLLSEVHSRISIQLGMNDSIIRNSIKLLNKED